MQARVGQLLQQGWNVASIICGMHQCSFLILTPSQYGQIARRDAFHHSPQTVSSGQRNGRYKPRHNNPTCHGAARLLVSFAMIARDSSNSDITAWRLELSCNCKGGAQGRTLANGVHGCG